MQKVIITLNIPHLRTTNKPGVFTLATAIREMDYSAAAKALGLEPDRFASDARKLESTLDHLQKLDIVDALRDSIDVRNIESDVFESDR